VQRLLSFAVLLLMCLGWLPAVGQDQAAQVPVEKPKYDPTWREEVDQIAKQQAEKIAQDRANPKPGVTYGTPTVTDKDGNVLNDTQILERNTEKWNQKYANGECARAAESILKGDSRPRNPMEGPASYMRNDKIMVAQCSLSPDDPLHGYKFRAILRNPTWLFSAALELINEKPRQAADH
jgi:hypothetical protein